MHKSPSERFSLCRERVHDDAFEAQLALLMVAPLLNNDLDALTVDYVHKSGIFLRRALTRYVTLALFRLLDKPNDSGRTGITVSIYSLLEMAKAESVLSDAQYRNLVTEIEIIKTSGAEGEYDLVQSIRDLRNIQVAHSLIPWVPTDNIYAHHLFEFTEKIFDYVVSLETMLATATGITLKRFAWERPNIWIKCRPILACRGLEVCLDVMATIFDPIELPSGRNLVTRRDAALLITKLPEAEQQASGRRTAAEIPILIAENGGDAMMAHIAMLRGYGDSAGLHSHRNFDDSASSITRKMPGYAACVATLVKSACFESSEMKLTAASRSSLAAWPQNATSTLKPSATRSATTGTKSESPATSRMSS